MADFRRKKRVVTKVPLISVDAGLPVGHYTFLLTVTDQQGNVSKSAKLGVEIIKKQGISDPIRRQGLSPKFPNQTEKK